MANRKISELTSAGALTGSELVEIVQSGTNKQTTTQDIADLGPGGGGGVTSVNGDSGPSVSLSAADIPNTPNGGVAATDVQTAINELDIEIDSRIAAAIAGIKWKTSVRAATTVAGTLASDFENGDSIDGVTLATGNRILLKNQADQTQNGIYTVNASGAPTRSTDADAAAELESAAVTVDEGTSNANTTWLQTTDSITLGVSNIVWTQYGSSVPDADASNKGIAKLYPSTSLGSNVDGAPTQNAVKVYTDAGLALKTNALVTYRTLTVDHTLDSTDLTTVNAGGSLIIEENQAIANDVTVPLNSSVAFTIGTVITIVQMGAGLTSVIADGGVTVNTSAGHLNSPGQNSPMILVKKDTNTWYLFNGLPSSVATWQNWGSSLTPAGFSSVATQRSYYQDDGQTVSVYVEISGTSNATTFQFSLPVALDATIYTTNSFMINVFIQNVGAGAAGRIYASGSGTLVTVDATVAGGAFTNSGTKALKAHLFYAK